ncbi:MAG: 50S ribosomal protein L18 [Myxococcales bacterium]|nr:50S ribosomal protein L18 [Myxococcales bacterium]
MATKNRRYSARIRRQKHVRKNVLGTSEKPRLSVFRSNQHIYAQLINDNRAGETAETLVTASSREAVARDGLETTSKSDLATAVGKLIAERCKEKGIKKVVFDRNGFLYHGRVKALADGAREAGLEF